MNTTQNILNAVTSPLAKEAGKTVVMAAATTAGMMAGLTGFAYGAGAIKRVKNLRVTTTDTPENES